MVAGLVAIVEIICIGGLIMLAVEVLAEILDWRECRKQAALHQRLATFQQAQRMRQTAAARQAACELNIHAHQTAQAMLRVAIEADCKAARKP